ncbi:DUF6345 domain-containing protein [Pseudactinotalea suaedae]|uniref:DUF6345 domain-containing protein n=1 Tax=Pseudactinotalea suaedae TaxID=1524924 RepID=UPI0012E1F41C|nr:DUF6345 domain-containing protein [Pseudactinotalea suaedae]
MATLPIFTVHAGRETDIDVDRLTRDVLGGRDLTAQTRGPATSIRGPEVHLDVDRGRGGVWAGDLGRLWDAAPTKIPGPAAVAEIATEALQRVRLLPELGRQFRLTKGTVRQARTVTERGSKRTTRSGEATFGQEVVVDVSDRDDIPGEAIPMLGGGGRFRATVGDGGQVTGAHGVWRDADAVDERPLLTQAQALRQAGISTRRKDVRITGSTLGYYSAPAFSGQELMFPVYAVSAEVQDGDRWVPSRVRLVPATDVGEIGVPESETPPRAEPGAFPDLKHLVVPGQVLPSTLTVSTSVLERHGVRASDLLTRGPNGNVYVKPQLDLQLYPFIWEALRPRSFGASWIGEFGGLGGSQANAQGFVDEMTAEGWSRRFNWGNQNAWKSDWLSNDDSYVDDVDIVFYTGHASPDGWMLATGGNSDWLHSSDVGAQPNSPSDHWGQENLEWAVVAACGPLQDDAINGGGSVFDRWRGIFDGMHVLLGYAAVTYDNTEEGRRFASYARSGMTLTQAWFRTAQEIQPSTNGWGDPYGPDVYAGALSIGSAAGSTGGDHLWGHGSVGPDIRGGGQYRVCQWSPC